MKAQKTLGFLVLVLPLCAFSAASNGADADLVAHVDGGRLLTANEMQELRGGFVDPTGLIYNFAVDVRTALNGSQIFSRSFNVSPSGPGGALQAVDTANLIAKNIPSNIGVSMIGNGSGIVITDPRGNNTTVLNQTARGTPSSIILNEGSDRDISQTVNMTLTLGPSISTYARETAQAALAQRLAAHALGL